MRPYPSQIYSILHFYALYTLTCDLASSFPFFFFRRREEKVPSSLERYVVNHPILHLIIYIQLRSIPFLNISRDHLPYAAHVGDHLRSRIICDLLGIICMQSGDHLRLGSFAVLNTSFWSDDGHAKQPKFFFSCIRPKSYLLLQQ